MLVKLDKVVPFTEVRTSLSNLLDNIKTNKFFVISRKNTPTAVLVDIEYFKKLEREAENSRLKKIQEELHVSTVNYLKNKLNKRDITDEDVYRDVSGKNNIEL